MKITVEIILDDEEALAVERIAETLEKPDHTQDLTSTKNNEVFDKLVESYVMGLVADKVMCILLKEAAE